MTNNPYESPAPAPERVGPRKLLAVAKAQKMVLYAVLASILGNILLRVVQQLNDLTAQIGVSVLVLAIVVFTMFAVFKLSSEFSSVVVSVLYCLAMLIPCVSLIVLLVINQQATTYLTKNGVKVGLMGAKKNQR